MELAAQVAGWTDQEALFRATLERLGLKRLTPSVLMHLRRIRPLAQPNLSARADLDL
jgi:hypothetical protein